MTSRNGPGPARPARTVLEALIRERQQTLEEFANYVEEFRREHNERGTLSLRHLERLVSGHRGDGNPLGPLRPATARLLEHIFGQNVSDLLSPPDSAPEDDTTTELRQRLHASRRVDAAGVVLLRDQINALRRLDRQLGAIVAYDEVTTKATQVAALQSHSLSPAIRADLAAVLAELNALAGWEALDRAVLGRAWKHHERAKIAAREANSTGLLAHALAQQAVILLDLGEIDSAVSQLAEARNIARRSTPALLRAWLAAAYSEGLAAAGCRTEALRAFDSASKLLPAEPCDPDFPFLFLGGAHLDRWHGHVLARLDHSEAIEVLVEALADLDPSFTRAEAALRIDLATALVVQGAWGEAQQHVAHARRLAAVIGSTRQRRRLRTFNSSKIGQHYSKFCDLH